MSRFATTFAGSLAVILFAATVQAAPLSLVKNSSIDVDSGFIQVDYSAATRIFTADWGFPESFTNLGAGIDHAPIESGQFTVSMALDSAGDPTGGSLSLTGSVPSLPGPASGTLLSGTLSQFGSAQVPPGATFEFIFKVTGGDLQSRFSPYVGVILSDFSDNFTGNFDATFTNDGNAAADTFAIPGYSPAVVAGVPTPAALPAGVTLLGAILAWRRLRKFRA